MSSNSHNNHGTFNNAFLFLNEEENRTATETRLPNRCSTPPAEEKETARQLFALALRVRDLLVLADTATVAEWRSTELVASWKLVIRFTQKLACLSAAQRCALCIQLRPHLKPSTICSDENTIQRDGDKREDNNPSGDLVNGVTFCELSQADKTLQRRLSANSHLRNCLYDQLQRLAKTSTDQFREAAIPAVLADWVSDFQAEMLVAFSGIYQQANHLKQTMKQRALILELEYNLSRHTSMKRASATMLACRMLTEHRVQSAAAVTLTTTSNNNNSNLNEPVINNTLCGFMQKLGRLLDHSPDILEIILMTLSIGESDLALKNCASVHCLEPSTETITDSTPKDLNDDNRQNSSLNTKAVTALEDKSTKKEKRCHVDWQSCRQQLLYWLLARSDSCSRRVYQLHPVLLAEVAESQQPFANVYADHLLKLTNAQLEAVPSSLNVTDANAASIPFRTHMVYLLPGMIPTTGSAALIYVPLRDYWCCLLTKGARMCQLICHRFTQLCSLSLESANETNTNTTNTTTDSNNNNNSSSSSHNNGSSMNDQPTTKMAASLKQYLINLGLDL